jgi:hypothetical protein
VTSPLRIGDKMVTQDRKQVNNKDGKAVFGQ